MNFQELEIFVLNSPEDSDAVRRGGDKKAPPAAHGRQAVPFSLSKKVTGRWPFFSLEILELRERMRYNSEG